VRFYDTTRDRQAEAGTAALELGLAAGMERSVTQLFTCTCASAGKLFECDGLILVRDANAGVCDGDFDERQGSLEFVRSHAVPGNPRARPRRAPYD
jgi:hypothetical protein